ncbi:hypothetical protein L1887_25516 [Cichorium endivia]|nr:hypothetical protein L1887_25516 [Cichorium endivia]
MDLLYFCPVIQTLCLSEGFEHGLDLGEDDRIWLLIPICVSNCLKTVTLKNFHANDSEICFLKRVLKYAHVLERMDIWWPKTHQSVLSNLSQLLEVVEEGLFYPFRNAIAIQSTDDEDDCYCYGSRKREAALNLDLRREPGEQI